MHVITAVNVRDALPKAVRYLTRYGYQAQTRVGDALVSTRPVTIRYSHPKEHVLVDKIRNANPFFHLMEAMWMLAGRDDGAFLDHYIKDFSKEFGTNGRIMDAYGYRWRHGLKYDQLHEIIYQLKKTPNTRQAVLQMWGAGRNDLIEPDPKPCNLMVSFQRHDTRLDMTVFNRSNDLVWGCCGANAVHFAILQEYVSSMINVKMGEYWQVSTNLHLYKKHKDMVSMDNLYQDYELTEPLIKYPDSFDEELQETMLCIAGIHNHKDYYDGDISNPFLRETVIPMALAHELYKKNRIVEALAHIGTVKAEDWKRAGKEWIERRIK